MSCDNNNAGFFAINRTSFLKACSVGLNEAVSYLVLARGTGKEHAKSSWSIQAIETYTGISRPRAHLAIQGLIAHDIIRKDKGGTRPRYTILYDKKTDPEWIWLPNALVTGASSETPPVEIVRQTQDVDVLRLLVELYYSQNLRADGGIHWRTLRQDWVIPRLKYRPHTKLTAAWFANTITFCADYKARYQAMLSQQQDNKTCYATSR